MKKSETIIKHLKSLLNSRTFKEEYTKAKKYFTRTRAFNFIRIIAFQLNIITRTLSVETNKFMLLILGEENLRTVREQSYSEARMKLDHRAYIALNESYVKDYYLDGEFKQYKSYRLVAIDSSNYRLPDTKENKREFGIAENTGKTIPMAKGSVALDCLNMIIVDSIISQYNSSERQLAIEHIKKIIEDKIKTIFIMDRGYPSLELIAMSEMLGFDYVIRYSSGAFLSELREFEVNKSRKDIQIEIDLMKKYEAGGHKELKAFLDLGIKTIKLRVVKIILEKDKLEFLVTSLLQPKGFSIKDLGVIYHLRWADETYFNYQKNILEVENFTGKKPESIYQDFYSKNFVSNIVSLIANDAEDEIEEEVAQNPEKYKYEKYKVNRSVLSGMLKDEIVRMIFLNDQKWQERYEYLVKVAKTNKIAVIEDRYFPRKKRINNNRTYLFKRKAF